MMNQVMKFLRDEEGATAIEYGLIAGLLAIAIVVVVGTVGDRLFDIFTNVDESLAPAAAPPAE